MNNEEFNETISTFVEIMRPLATAFVTKRVNIEIPNTEMKKEGCIIVARLAFFMILYNEQDLVMFVVADQEPERFITKVVEDKILLSHELIMDGFVFFLHKFVFHGNGSAEAYNMANQQIPPFLFAKEFYLSHVKHLYSPEGSNIRQAYGRLLEATGPDEFKELFNNLGIEVFAYTDPRTVSTQKIYHS